jgi:hypothetical protein
MICFLISWPEQKMMKLANTQEEYIALAASSGSEFVTSRESWARARLEPSNALARLSPAAIDQFEDTMRFSGGVLVSAHIELITEELEDDLKDFYALFGVGPELMGKITGQKCMGASGCKPFKGWTCTFDNNGGCTNGE